MKKMIAVVIAGVFAAAGAYAQNPAGTSSEQQEILNSKEQLKAQAKVDARQHGEVKKAGGDELKSTQNDIIGADKSATAGQSRAHARKARHPNRKPAGQGGTPDMAGAK